MNNHIPTTTDVFQPAITNAIKQIPQSTIFRFAFGPLIELHQIYSLTIKHQRTEGRYMFQALVIICGLIAGTIMSQLHTPFITWVNSTFPPTVGNGFFSFYLCLWIFTYPMSGFTHYAIQGYFLFKYGDSQYYLYQKRLRTLEQECGVTARDMRAVFNYIRDEFRAGTVTLHARSGTLDIVLTSFMYGGSLTTLEHYTNHKALYEVALLESGNLSVIHDEPRVTKLAESYGVTAADIKTVLLFCADRLRSDHDAIGARKEDYAIIISDILAGNTTGNMAFIVQQRFIYQQRVQIEEYRQQNYIYKRHLEELKKARQSPRPSLPDTQDTRITQLRQIGNTPPSAASTAPKALPYFEAKKAQDTARAQEFDFFRKASDTIKQKKTPPYEAKDTSGEKQLTTGPTTTSTMSKIHEEGQKDQSPLGLAKKAPIREEKPDLEQGAKTLAKPKPAVKPPDYRDPQTQTLTSPIEPHVDLEALATELWAQRSSEPGSSEDRANISDDQLQILIDHYDVQFAHSTRALAKLPPTLPEVVFEPLLTALTTPLVNVRSITTSLPFPDERYTGDMRMTHQESPFGTRVTLESKAGEQKRRWSVISEPMQNIVNNPAPTDSMIVGLSREASASPHAIQQEQSATPKRKTSSPEIG